MTGFVVPGRPGAAPRARSEFARAMARPRTRASGRAWCSSCCSARWCWCRCPTKSSARVEEYARELGVDDRCSASRSATRDGSLGLALIDFQRSGYMETWDPTHSTALHTSRRAGRRVGDVLSTTRRSRSTGKRCAISPTARSGREVAKFYDARGLRVPRPPGSAPPLLAQHDWVHVLADYGSTVECEIEVFGVHRPRQRRPARVLVARDGDQPVRDRLPARAARASSSTTAGHLSHEGMAVRLADAMRRGALVRRARRRSRPPGARLVRRRGAARRRRARRARRRAEVGLRDRVRAR